MIGAWRDSDWSERAFFLFIMAVVAFAIAMIILVPSKKDQPCWDVTSQSCIDYRIDQCMITERYTLDQCVTLIGGGK